MLWRWSKSASPLEFAVAKNASASPVECALTKLLDLKSPEINTYKNMPGVPPPFRGSSCPKLVRKRQTPTDLNVTNATTAK